MTFHNLRNFPQFVNNLIESLWSSKIKSDISTCLIANLLWIDDELRALNHSKVSKFLYALMNCSTTNITCSRYFKERNASIICYHSQNLLV